jgi:hypothetical protein
MLAGMIFAVWRHHRAALIMTGAIAATRSCGIHDGRRYPRLVIGR